jgi:hypothetical protein
MEGENKSKVTMALNSLVKETEKKVKLAEEKQELIQVLSSLIEMTRSQVYAANSYSAFIKAVEVVRKHITQPVVKEG